MVLAAQVDVLSRGSVFNKSSEDILVVRVLIVSTAQYLLVSIHCTIHCWNCKKSIPMIYETTSHYSPGEFRLNTQIIIGMPDSVLQN